MNDFEYQVTYVLDAVERIMSQVDLDPSASTYGCAHLAYWRDKTSDVADMRRQEAMLTLALVYSREYPGSHWRNDRSVLQSVEALLRFWALHQNTDGSFDEWYKGERGFAATAFTAHAAARTLLLIGDELEPALQAAAHRALRKAADWLVTHDDLFKTNHQAVAVCALVWCASALKNGAYTVAAARKFASIREVQREEGWFPEVGNVDIGYTFLTVEFLAMAMDAQNDRVHMDCLTRAFDFASRLLDPQARLGEEYSICRNTYVSRIAIVLMSRYSQRAGTLLWKLKESSVGFDGIRPILADELRLNRWAYLPLLAYDYCVAVPADTVSRQTALVTACASRCPASMQFRDAGVVRIDQPGYSGVFTPAAGGSLRLFDGDGRAVIADFGYAVVQGRMHATNYVYNRKAVFAETADGFELRCAVVPVKKIFPAFAERVLLRVACATAIGARASRAIIDAYRLRKGTALNQSSSTIKAQRSVGHVDRMICVGDSEVVITDRLTFVSGVSARSLFILEANDYARLTMRRITDVADIPRKDCRRLTVRKRFRISDGKWTCVTDVVRA